MYTYMRRHILKFLQQIYIWVDATHTIMNKRILNIPLIPYCRLFWQDFKRAYNHEIFLRPGVVGVGNTNCKGYGPMSIIKELLLSSSHNIYYQRIWNR